MPISTYKTYLMCKNGSNYEKLIEIKEYPDLGGEPESLETTTLSDSMQTFIAGIQTSEGMKFTANYTLEEYKRIKAMEGETRSYAVWFGGENSSGVVVPNGEHGKFEFDGQLSVYPTAKGVNEVVEMGITILPSTPIELKE